MLQLEILQYYKYYAPINDSEDEGKKDSYEQLQAEVAMVLQHDMLLVMGDMNAKMGSDNGETDKLLSQQQLCHRWDNLPTQRYSQTDMEVT